MFLQKVQGSKNLFQTGYTVFSMFYTKFISCAILGAYYYILCVSFLRKKLI